ncbi:hypothetical protein GF366_03285 [Candidatus Peregrinibacteria bacterium]|nr:hypothetical protein [Candidatus Peregrinibacteria bacterium]
MKITVVKNDKESNERLISRFNKKVQASRKILRVRAERYHTPSKTKRLLRQAAIMREKYRAKNARSRFY